MNAITSSLGFYAILAARLVLACLLGGVIGFEREHMNKPAGLRTHTLVCVGSALVMVTSEFIFKKYSGHANMDPARLGAQVISGIGFLGAGTIMREGITIKGLTTAATLWVVACVGIAVGAGFYEGAVIATILIYIALIVLKRIHENSFEKNRLEILFVQTDNIPGMIGVIGSVFGKYNVTIKNIEFIDNADEKNILLKFLVKLPYNVKKPDIIEDLHNVKGVHAVHEE